MGKNLNSRKAVKSHIEKCALDGTWFDDYGNIYNVIAWQPLPNAYQPEQKGDAG